MLKKELIAAYQQTCYLVFEPYIEIFIGKCSPFLQDLLQEKFVFTWAYITAYNPKSNLLPNTENELRHRQLLNELDNYICYLGEGKAIKGGWAAEKSLLVLGITKGKAGNIASKFGQNAYLFGEIGKAAKLEFPA